MYVKEDSQPFSGVNHDCIPMGEVWVFNENVQYLDSYGSVKIFGDNCGVGKRGSAR